MTDDRLRLAPYAELTDQELASMYRLITHANLRRIDKPFADWESGGVDVQALHAVILSREGLMDSIFPPTNRSARRAVIRRKLSG